ncbi:tryptophan halogenase family protein [Xanthomonas maliensis]|uniref:tryptophan halogenase family protein n=1 Tax=Xanthomonas maliensis TaxID=1321368 RepID=UPI0003A68D6F|nr:tryptophan halogenase family protein [Xanthomonas maliensis]KAB7764220.1 tryptophan 7-halogenase [Xanthomonas maliensis]
MTDTVPTDPRQRPVRRVVIAGGGTAGWMAAAALSKVLGRQLQITLVESDEIGTVGVGEATIPSLVTFHRLLEIDEAAFMAATQATIKLGIGFEHWRDVDQHYIHSFGQTGTDHWTAGFQHFWLKGRTRGLARAFGDYCLELRAAQEGRFAHLPQNGLNYAYHLDAGLYARFLRRFSEGYGVQRVEGRVAQVQTDPHSGYLTALTLEDGRQLEGDLFLDCTGFRALLIGQTLGVDYDDWSHWLFADSALAVQTTSVGAPVPYTRSRADRAGWMWRIPLQHRVGNGMVYASRYLDQEAAWQVLQSHLQGEVLTEPRPLRFIPNQRHRVWEKNCVALGLASGFLEPLESTNIHLIQRGIIRLMQTFPQVIAEADIAEYNRQAAAEIAHIRDFVILHYHATDRRDTPFWRDCAAMAIPDSLRHRVELFRQSGRVFHQANELFAENSWIQVLLGQGVMPQQHHPVADLMGDSELAQFLEGLRQRVEATVARLPSHADFLRRYCPAPVPVTAAPPATASRLASPTA